MRTFRGIPVALAAGAAAGFLLAGCGSGHKDNPGGDPPTPAPPTKAGGCPSDTIILGYAKKANGGALPDGSKVVSKTCEAGWVVARVSSPGADQATLVSQADGGHAVLGTSLCEDAGQFPAQVRVLLHC